MDKKYVELFRDLAQATAVAAEQVMEYDKSQGEDEAFEAAKLMRDRYQELAENLNTHGENYQLKKTDVAELLIAAVTQQTQIEERIGNLRKALVGYQTDVTPKLQKILDAANDDNDAANLANENFILEDNK